MLRGMESQDASPFQISSKLDNPLWSSCDFSILKMAAATNKPSRSGHRGPNILRPEFIDNVDDDDDDDEIWHGDASWPSVPPLLIKCEISEIQDVSGRHLVK